MNSRLLRLIVLTTAAFVFAGLASAGEKKLMHCFYFTPVEEATQEDWDAFYKVTDELPGKIPGLTKVWAGKLRRSIPIYNSQGEKRDREYGVCMEMDNEEALGVYADHPAHKEWEEVYFKVRQRGTTTFDIIGR